MKSTTVVLALVLAALVPAFGSPAAPLVVVITTPASATPTPAIVGQNVRFDVGATGAGLTYQWDFGDGTVDPVSGISFRDHVYAAPGHYDIAVVVNDVSAVPVVNQFKLVVHHPPTTAKPTNSSTIILDSTNSRVWVVNPDQDTVSTIDTGTNLVTEIPVGKNPRTLARAADGTIWVVSQGHPSISVIHPTTFALLHVVPLPHGSAPYGIAMTPDGTAAYVTFQGSGGLAKVSTSSRAVLATAVEPPTARGVSVTADGRVLVTRFISPQSDPLAQFNTVTFATENRGEVVEFNSSLTKIRTFPLALDPGLDLTVVGGTDPDFGPLTPPSSNASRGVPNYLTSLVITPDGRRAWVPSKKDNVQRGQRSPERDSRTPGPEVAYRAIVSSIDLVNNTEQLSERQDIDNSEMPQAACVSKLGDYIFIALQGTNRIQVRDLFDMSAPLNGIGEPSGTTPTNGLAPQGLVIDPATNTLYVQNYMGRTVSVFDVAPILNGTGTSLGAPTAVIGTVLGADLLGTTVLQGKQVFYNAADPRMSLNGYISCAGCHLDGGSDMRVFDFTNRGEGFRNTVMLQGRAGTGHGNVHWSANFDEIQDFDNDVFFQFHNNTGTQPSFTSAPLPTDPGSPNPPLSVLINGARNADLDALAAYVASLDKVARSPFRNADGTLTAQGAAGEAVFKTLDCQRCHTGRNFTDSVVGNLAPAVNPVGPVPPNTPILHDVGTIKPTSGQRLNSGPLPGVDTPTLKGIWQTAPYLHDGSAATLEAMFAVTGPAATAHFGRDLTPQEQADLVRYMIEIDEVDAPPVPPAQVNTLSLGANASSRPYSLSTAAVGRLPYIDRSYAITALPGPVTGGILLRTAEDDKASTAANQVQVTVPAGTNVFVYYDSRRTSLPTWLQAGWTATGDDIVISPGVTMNGFQMTPAPAAGTVTLGGNLEGGPNGALRNYIVILVNGGAIFEEGPISRGEWVHEQDGDGDGLRDDYEATTSVAVAGLSPWKLDSVAAGTADEDQLSAGATLFAAQPPLSSGGGGGGGGSSGGCGLGGMEFLIPMLALRLARRRLR